MNDKDKHNLELLLSHCQLMESHVKYFGDDIDEYMNKNITRQHADLNFLKLENISIDYLMNSLKNMTKLIGADLSE